MLIILSIMELNSSAGVFVGDSRADETTRLQHSNFFGREDPTGGFLCTIFEKEKEKEKEREKKKRKEIKKKKKKNIIISPGSLHMLKMITKI